MLANKSFLAIIPARGGSKGIPNKNIHPCHAKPLISWTIEAAQASRYIDRLILSSDDEMIINVAKDYQCEVPFTRPQHLAEDDTPGIAPILHAIEQLPDYDYVMVLQPTSPLRSATDIDQCLQHCLQQQASSCVSVCKVEQNPFWMYTKSTQGELFPLFPGEQYHRRQELPKVYRLNGAIYLAQTSWLKTHKSFLTEHTLGFEMSLSHSVDVDTLEDLKHAEQLLMDSVQAPVRAL